MKTEINVICQPDERVIFFDIENRESIWDGRSGLKGEISCFFPNHTVGPEVKIIFADRRITKTRAERRAEKWRETHEAD